MENQQEIDEEISSATTYLKSEELFEKLYDRLPKEILFIRELILSSLWRSPEHWDQAEE